jgi:GAF domain-containing protein
MLLGQSDDALAVLVEEQAALRRVATLVASESSPEAIFGAVTEEARRVVGSEAVGLLRFVQDGVATLIAQSDTPWDPPPLGTRLPLDGENVLVHVLRTGDIARVDDWTDSTGAVAAMATMLGVRSAVAAPVVVEGSLWGTIIAATSQPEPLSPDTESRIEQFTSLVATAIANAEARGALSRLAEEQAALRRVAVLVAQQPSPEEVFAAVAEAVGSVLGADMSAMVVFPDDVAGTVVATWSFDGAMLPIGTRLPLDSDSAVARIFHTGAAARIDGYTTGAGAEIARALGMRCTVGAPILVGGKLWGALAAAVRKDDPLPEDAEARIAAFTELVATAVSNTQAREDLERLADEQAALRRVATLVAQGIGPEGVFGAVAVEVGAIFGADVAAIVRFEDDGTAIVLGDVGGPHVSGKRVSLDEGYVVHRVRETARPARFDTDDPSAADMPSLVRALGIRSSVASPIVVERELWGAITAASVKGPLPSSAERRLSEFTELVATAVANTQSREDVTALADEQAALRRVATLVAEDAPPDELFRAVTVEVGTLLGVDFSGMARVAEGAILPLAVWAADGEQPALPDQWPLQAGDPTSVIAEARRTVRWDDWGEIEGSHAEYVRGELGVRSTVGTPIIIEGEAWGVLAVHSRGTLPQGSEARIEQFSNLVATAIGNAEARGEVQRLANEQAALQRIATLVAAGALPEQVFAAVAGEAAAAFNAVTAVLRFEHDPPAFVVVGISHETGTSIGTRQPLAEGLASTGVYRTGRPARRGAADWASDTGPASEALLWVGVTSAVACPIIVEGRRWGAVTLNAEHELPSDTEQRLEKFTELVTTAIANTEARAAVRAAAEEQGALRRVATLVAASAAPSDVFAAVTGEIALVLGADATLLCRADPDGTAVVVGTWDARPDLVDRLEIGTRIPRGGTNLVTTVLETGHSARIESYSEATGPASEVARTHGLRSAVGAPILVEGRRWGLVIAGTTSDEVLPPDAEERLAGFTELIATAIANAQARGDLTGLAEQQAALRRVATLVARRAAPEVIFRAVAEEAGGLLGADLAVLVRIESDNTVTVMAGPAPVPHQAGERLTIDPSFVVEAVRETGRPARFETDDPAAEGMPEVVRQLGIRSAVASPIVVEGALWGALILGSVGEPLPPGMEQRLDDFTELVATGISNATARAELLASRARIVAAGDEERRRIERNLHDGTQQRLVSLGFAVRTAEAGLPPERDDLRAQLSSVATGLIAAVEDLQEISRGIHPAILSKGGLGPALQALAHRSAIPVDLDLRTRERIAEPIEIAAYFVASEALANAAKYSQASRIDLRLEEGERGLLLSIGDDGVGGADAARGSGLVGLTDRVEALGGSIRVTSRPGAGTQIAAEFPRELELPQPIG